MSAGLLHVVIVASHPIQYFVPVYRQLAADSSIRLTVIFSACLGIKEYYDPGFGREIQWDVPLVDGYPSIFLSASTELGGVKWRVVSELLRLRPDVVLFQGYNQPTNLLGMLVAKLLGSKVLMRGDTRISPRNSRGGLKYQLKKWLFRTIDGFMVIGSLNRAYYQYHGVASHKLFFAPFCVDNREFDLKDRAPAARARGREALSITEDKKVLLFVAKLTEQKRPHDLLQALSLLTSQHPDAMVIFAGSGTEEPALREQAAAQDLDVRFLGFVNQSKLPELYAASDVFVLPSASEAWGLVINEAMAAGLPVVTTNDVGAAPDLLIGKDTGSVYPAGDVQALAESLGRLLSSPAELKAMGDRARNLITAWDVAACAEGIREAAFNVTGRRPHQETIV